MQNWVAQTVEHRVTFLTSPWGSNLWRRSLPWAKSPSNKRTMLPSCLDDRWVEGLIKPTWKCRATETCLFNSQVRLASFQNSLTMASGTLHMKCPQNPKLHPTGWSS